MAPQASRTLPTCGFAARWIVPASASLRLSARSAGRLRRASGARVFQSFFSAKKESLSGSLFSRRRRDLNSGSDLQKIQ